MTADEARTYHAVQVRSFAAAPTDLVTATTMTYAEEAIGIAKAAQAAGLPVVISFTVETDGRLPIRSAAWATRSRPSTPRPGGYPAYYMVNCAHPTHFQHLFADTPAWTERLGGMRANASTLSHTELDEAETLDSGDPVDLAERYQDLRQVLPTLRVLGGCCGTDHRHIDAISRHCVIRRGDTGRAGMTIVISGW